MRRSALAVVSAAAVLIVSSLALATTAGATPPPQAYTHRNTHVCGAPTPGTASCKAIRHDTVDRNGKPAPAASAPVNGYHASDLRQAYNLGDAPAGATVAVVDAYDAPSAAQDLKAYRSAMGLPACSTGCFTKVNQDGSTSTRSLPRADGGWAQEISLDLDMVSAACPGCKILLVEARSASFSDLATAVNTAVALGAKAVSNSYGGGELNTGSFAGAYDHPGIAVTASTGDDGYGAQVPAAFPGVVAVGGTSLTKDANGGWSEKAWAGAGSGCSAYYTQPTYQAGATQCDKKAVADVSAVADPNTGVAVYDSYGYQGFAGWLVFGGTSASAPFIAGLYAQAHDFGSSAAAFTWGNSSQLKDVTDGSNGTCSPAPSLWCNSVAKWDGPTGLGTPNGTGAF